MTLIRPAILSLLLHAALFAAGFLILHTSSGILSAPAHPAQEVGLAHVDPEDRHPDPAAKSGPGRVSTSPASRNASDTPAAASSTVAPSYLLRVREKISSRIHYPESLRRARTSGHLVLEIAIDSRGSLTDARVLESSGISGIDQVALNAVHDSAPFEEPGSPVQFRLPVELRIGSARSWIQSGDTSQ